ncbi:MAG: Spy/CpxP family protein refolding chaperone [Candidatus Ozemobacteraceae bacterium]
MRKPWILCLLMASLVTPVMAAPAEGERPPAPMCSEEGCPGFQPGDQPASFPGFPPGFEGHGRPGFPPGFEGHGRPGFPPGPPPGGMMMGKLQPSPEMMLGGMFRVFDKMQITDEQLLKLRNAYKKHGEAAASLKKEKHENQRGLEEILNSEKDENQAETALTKQAELFKKSFLQRMKLMSDLRSILTPEQFKNLTAHHRFMGMGGREGSPRGGFFHRRGGHKSESRKEMGKKVSPEVVPEVVPEQGKK